MRKALAITGIITMIVIIVLIKAYHSSGPTPNNQSANAAATTSGITFSDSPLLDSGVTTQQLSNFEGALKQYLTSQGETNTQVSFSSLQRTPPDPNATSPFSEINFNVQLVGKDTYKAKLDSFSLSEIRLYLYATDGTLLYDSQNVGGAS